MHTNHVHSTEFAQIHSDRRKLTSYKAYKTKFNKQKNSEIEQGFLACGYFKPMPTRKFSADLSRLALGLKGLTTLKVSLKCLTNWL